MTNFQAIAQLLDEGIINHKTALQFINRAKKAAAKQAKEARQERVNGAVAFAVGSLLKDHEAVQHRAVWNLVGREEASRDEVLNGLRSLRAEGALTSFKKSGNNFQIFWMKTPAE